MHSTPAGPGRSEKLSGLRPPRIQYTSSSPGVVRDGGLSSSLDWSGARGPPASAREPGWRADGRCTAMWRRRARVRSHGHGGPSRRPDLLSAHCGPKEARSFISFLRGTFRSLDDPTGEGTSIASVGMGDSFGLVRVGGPDAGEGFQLDVVGGIFAQFDLGAASNDLINADYLIGCRSRSVATASASARSCTTRALIWATNTFFA